MAARKRGRGKILGTTRILRERSRETGRFTFTPQGILTRKQNGSLGILSGGKRRA